MSVRILTRLHAADLRALRDVLPGSWTLQETTDVSDLVLRAHRSHFELAILDSTECSASSGANGVPVVFHLYRDLCIPIIVVAPPSFESMDNVVQIARGIPVRVILQVSRGSLDGAVAAVARALEPRLALRVLHKLEEHTRSTQLSAESLRVIQHLFHEPKLYRSVGATRLCDGVKVRLLNTELSRAGFKSFKDLRRIARISHAYELMMQFGMKLREVTERVGAGSVDSLIREAEAVTGVGPHEACTRLPEDDFISVAFQYALGVHTQ
jgi:hypothetical protein